MTPKGVHYNRSYSYDLASNVAKMSGTTYTYDSTGRLTSASNTDLTSYGTLSYLYDLNGNRQFETRNAAVMPYVYNPSGSNWLYQRGGDTRGKTPNGNTASISDVATFTYDGYNRLATSTTAAEVTTYTYNALGERIKKRNQNGLQTVFHYGPSGELLYEKDQAGNTKEYVWLHGRPLARIDNGSSIYYYHVDHLGTPQSMTDAARAVVWRADYEPFGKATVKVSTIENNLRLPGQYFDRETGLHYNYFRDYDPGTGRYVEADPIGLDGGMNLYGYANQNPLMFIDPDGLAFFAKRPLSGMPWMGPASNNLIDDYFNTEISHEQLFFEDGGNPANIGFFDDGTLKTEPNPKGYRKRSSKFNDCIMRKAVAKIGRLPSYCLIGRNCQTWAERARDEYARLEKIPQVQKECEVCNK